MTALVGLLDWNGYDTLRSTRPRARRGCVAACLVAFGMAWWSTTAAAAPIIVYNLQPFGVGELVNAGSLPVTSASLSNATGSGSGAVRVEHGALGGYAQAQGKFGVLSSLAYSEKLTVTSGSLAAGTPVDLLISLDLDYALSGSTGGGSIEAFLGLGSAQSPQAFTRFNADSDSGITLDQRTAVFHTFVGDVIELVAQLHVGASAGNCCENGFGEADALNTMHFFIDPVGLDPTLFSYVSETGAPYLSPPPPSTAVPEPATLSLLAAGLAGVIARRRRSSDRSRPAA
jgi:hypothetical protein